MTKNEIEQFGIRYFSADEFKEKQKVNAEQMVIRDKFLKRFTPAFVKKMDIDDYVEGNYQHTIIHFATFLSFSLNSLA